MTSVRIVLADRPREYLGMFKLTQAGKPSITVTVAVEDTVSPSALQALAMIAGLSIAEELQYDAGAGLRIGDVVVVTDNRVTAQMAREGGAKVEFTGEPVHYAH